MAIDMEKIIELKKDTNNGLLSKIKIGDVVYELKDLIAREGVKEVYDKLVALSAQHGTDVAAINALIEALDSSKADKEQVAKDIKAAVDAEAEIARAAEKANADEIARVEGALDGRLDKVEAFFEGAAEDSEGLNDALDTLKEIQAFINTEGTTADKMVKDIAANAEAIAQEVKDRGAADEALGKRIDDIEEVLGEDGSVDGKIADALEEAKGYTDDEIGKLGDLAKKDLVDLDLKALAHKDSATGTVPSQTISGVKATGTAVTGVALTDTAVEKDLSASGKFTPAGNIAVDNIVIPEHSVPVVVTNNDAQATVATGVGTANAAVTVVPATTQVIGSFTHGTEPTFVEGKFTAATLDREDVTANYAKEGLVGKVEEETLVFTAAGIEAITATKITGFTGGSKAADTWDAGTDCTVTYATVVSGIDSANASIEYEKVTGVTYKKAEENAAGTCAGSTLSVAATFTGTEGAVNVGGKYTDTTYTASATTGAIELAVGDIAVAEKTVTVTAQ